MKKALLALLPLISLFSCNTLSFTKDKSDSLQHENVLEMTISELRKSKTPYLFELSPSDTTMTRKVCSYPIVKEFTSNNATKQILDFILSDSTLYESDYSPVKQPFYPTFGFKPNKKSKYACLISFGTEEIAFSDNDSTYITFKLNSTQSLSHLYNQLTNINQ